MPEEKETNTCEVFLNSIVHPNEQVLAREIMEGKKLGEFSLSFDQAQIDTMSSALRVVGCEIPGEEVKDDGEDTKVETNEGTEGVPPAVPEVPLSQGNTTAEDVHDTGLGATPPEAPPVDQAPAVPTEKAPE